MIRALVRWGPAALFGAGIVLLESIGFSTRQPLRRPLHEAVPERLGELEGRTVFLSEGERRVVGVTDYLARYYVGSSGDGKDGISLYVGYYDRQIDGKTIHSPKNCLPGAGWEALQSSTTTIRTPTGIATVNRYLIRKGSERALVLYWYQGRGRFQANEYTVKWNLLRDAALSRRSEEALVRIVVPVKESSDATLEVARRSAEVIARGVYEALPI